MRPSSWKRVGAMAKVPVASWVSFMGSPLSCLRHSGMRPLGRRPGIHNPPIVLMDSGLAPEEARPGMTGCNSKSPRRFLDLILREENLPGVIDDILRPPSLARRLPAVH